MESRKESDPNSSTPTTRTTPSTTDGAGRRRVHPQEDGPVAPPEQRLKIIIDTREQRGWTFPTEQVAVARRALPAGDYSVEGLEEVVALERKSLGDFVNTIMHEWIRFRKELNRLSGYECAAVAIEADIGQIYRHEYESDALPTSVLGRMNGILIDHGIPCLLWGDRKLAQDMAHRFLLLAWRKYHVEGPTDPAAPR